MRALGIALFVALAVSAAGFLFLRDSAPVPKVEESGGEITSIQFQALEILPQVAAPVNPAETRVETPHAEEVQTPVQPIDERGDAMLFEAEALNGTPFDYSIVMPFD